MTKLDLVCVDANSKPVQLGRIKERPVDFVKKYLGKSLWSDSDNVPRELVHRIVRYNWTDIYRYYTNDVYSVI